MSFRSILTAVRSVRPLPRVRAAGRRAGFRPRLEPLDDRCLLAADVVLEWNQVMLDALKADRLLPLYLAREAAIVHAAVYDAVNAIDRSYTPLFAHVHASRGASLQAAAAQAAHDTLVELSPDGAREAEQALGPRLDAMAELFEGFSAAEQQAFADALARLGRAMQARPGEC